MDDRAVDDADQLVQVRPRGVAAGGPDEAPFLVLEETGGDRRLPIAIGNVEANAIAFAMQHIGMKRPMTHDALKQAIDALGGTVVRIVIGFEPDSNTFTADVVVGMPDGSDRHLDWRVSDAVALAVRYETAPLILVPEAVLSAPPPGLMGPAWPQRVRVQCPCGAWISAGEQLVQADPTADYLEADLDCRSCGERRHVRIKRPPAAHAPG
ncbi:MAG: bifunctional nuclease family protein [Acidimicrobiales bacterium]